MTRSPTSACDDGGAGADVAAAADGHPIADERACSDGRAAPDLRLAPDDGAGLDGHTLLQPRARMDRRLACAAPWPPWGAWRPGRRAAAPGQTRGRAAAMTSAAVPSGTRAAKAGATRQAEARVAAEQAADTCGCRRTETWPAPASASALHVMDEEAGIGAGGEVARRPSAPRPRGGPAPPSRKNRDAPSSPLGSKRHGPPQRRTAEGCHSSMGSRRLS